METDQGPLISTPDVLLGLDKKRQATAKRKDRSVIIIVQEQVDNRKSVVLANERLIRSIGDTFHAIELVVCQARRICRFLAGNHLSKKP